MLLARSLTPTQRAVLGALLQICSDSGQHADEAAVAAHAGLDRRTTVLSLTGLQRRGLVAREHADGERIARPTWAGRDCAHLVVHTGDALKG